MQQQCVDDFCHCDESSNIDSNSRRTVKVTNEDGIVEKHVGRVWLVSTVDEQYNLFLNSETVQNYLTLHQSFIVPSRSFFYRRRCPCITNPSLQSCVDIIRSSLKHYISALSRYIHKNKDVKDQLTRENWLPLLGGDSEEFVYFTCCKRIEHPVLTCGVGSNKKIPKFIQWKCAYGECNECGVKKS